MSFFTKRYHEPGTPPGTLQSAEAPATPASQMLHLSYGAEGVSEQRFDPNEPWQVEAAPSTVDWLHLQGSLTPAQTQSLVDRQGLHPLAVEDVVNQGQRAKLEVYDDGLFLVLVMPVLVGGELTLKQVSLFLHGNQVISFASGEEDPFGVVRERLQHNPGKLVRSGADYLLYMLIDRVVDEAFPVLEHYSLRLEELEEQMVLHADAESLRELHAMKRQLILLRRALWPQRELLGELARGVVESISDETRVYLRDCFDHGLHIMDMLETSRDMLLSLHELYLSSVSNRMNEVMRTLTVIATIFIPLTFIAGIYGMNFETAPDNPWSMPELGWRYGYVVTLGVMVLVAWVMLMFFKKKKWL